MLKYRVTVCLAILLSTLVIDFYCLNVLNNKHLEATHNFFMFKYMTSLMSMFHMLKIRKLDPLEMTNSKDGALYLSTDIATLCGKTSFKVGLLALV